MTYTLANYLIEAGKHDFAEWAYVIPMKRFDVTEQALVPMEPWPHQKSGLKASFEYDRFGLYDDAGVGKTVPMQAYAIYSAMVGRKTVITMPPKLIGQFCESLVDTYYGVDDYVSIYALDEKQKDAKAYIESLTSETAPDILIMSYDMFAFLQPIKPRKAQEIKNSKTGHVRHVEAVKPLRKHPLLQLGYRDLIFDEAQKLKNPESATHKRLWRWIKSSEGLYKIILATGSPVYNTLMDAYGLIRLVTPYAYQSLRHFKQDHVIYDEYSDFPTIIGWKDEEGINEKLYAQARRVTKEDVMPDLPSIMPHEHQLRLGPKHKKLYKEFLTERVIELEDEFIDATHVSKFRQVALQMISCPERFSDEPVPNVMESWLDELLEDINAMKNKVVVFCYYKSTVEKLVEKYKHLGAASINGASSTDNDRVRFIKDPECRIIFINWLSGGAGLNLQIAHYCIFYEIPTVPGDIEQAIARLYRGGQKYHVSVHIPRIMGTLANKSLNQLLTKQLKKNEVVRDKHELLAELLGKS